MTEEQLRVLGHPLRGELLGAFNNFGPASVAEVASRLGRPPKSMYYPVRKMVEVGLLREVGYRGEGTRKEVLYDVVANAYLLARDRHDPAYLGQVTAAIEQTLRCAAREYAAANQPGASPRPFILRRSVSLTSDELEELKKLLQQAVDFMESHHAPTKPHRVALTGVVTPIAK